MAKRTNSTSKEVDCKRCSVTVIATYNRDVVFCKKCLDKNWREQNAERYAESVKRCHVQNGDKYYARNKKYKQHRLENDIEFRLKKNLRARISNVLKGDYKSGSAIRDLGCSSKELKLYLESQFESGMSWDNYGLRGWHIDHIIPLCKFDLTNSQQFKLATHYTNLRPLWATDNWSKGGK